MWEEGFSKMKGCNLLSYYLLSPKLHSNDSCKMRIVTTSFVISKLVGSFSVSKARIFVCNPLAMRKTICRKVRATHIHVKKCIKKRKPTKLCIEKSKERERLEVQENIAE